MPLANEPPEPWRSFFADLDTLLKEDVQLHCCGGFVATHLYGVPRTTSDIDFLGVVPAPIRKDLIELAGQGSALHKKHRVHLDAVTVNTPPVGYQDRLVSIYSTGAWVHLQLFALEAHDLALSKLERNIERDRDDVAHLARADYLKPGILRERYWSEMRPYLIGPEDRHDSTLRLWLESYWNLGGLFANRSD